MLSPARFVAALVLLVSCKGDKPVDKADYPSVPEAALQGTVRTRLDSLEPTPAQLARRDRSLAVLASKQLPSLDDLPVVEDEAMVKPRDVDEIVHRCLAILVCAAKGETNDQALAEDLARDFGVAQSLTPVERRFFEDPRPTQQALVDYSWQYEAVHVLLWSLGYVPALAEPNEQFDVSIIVGLVKGRTASDLVANAKPRSMSELLDMADLYYHLHWAAIELRLRGQNNAAVHEGTIRERHRALNWLIRYMNLAWDDVTTDT